MIVAMAFQIEPVVSLLVLLRLIVKRLFEPFGLYKSVLNVAVLGFSCWATLMALRLKVVLSSVLISKFSTPKEPSAFKLAFVFRLFPLASLMVISTLSSG